VKTNGNAGQLASLDIDVDMNLNLNATLDVDHRTTKELIGEIGVPLLELDDHIHYQGKHHQGKKFD
jgi:hypothetical protein